MIPAKLSYKQKLWLHSRGGRTASDVFIYDNTPYILMFGGSREVPFKVPDTHELKTKILGDGRTVVEYVHD